MAPSPQSASPILGQRSAFRPVQAQAHEFRPLNASVPYTFDGSSRPKTTFTGATIDLLHVYKTVCPDFNFAQTIPRRCLTKPSGPCYNDGRDNRAHDLILHVRDVLTDANNGDEYVVIDMLGTGTFGQVVKCFHKRLSSFVAVKIVKNQPAYSNQAWVEISILRMLHQDNAVEDTRHIVRCLHHFDFRGHLCLVFEKLSINLYELLRQHRYAGVSMNTLRSFLYQLLKALCVLARSEVVHCDVKPENILLNAVDSTDLKLIDFGSACQLQHTVYSYVQSRFYRSPEILLGMSGYSTQIDMWSLGCVAGELFLGIPMFPGQNGMNMVCRIADMLGSFPDKFLRRCTLTSKFFNEVSSGDEIRVYRIKSLDEYESENRVRLPEWRRYFKDRRLLDIIMNSPHRSHTPGRDEIALRESFVDFLGGLLKIDPADRWTPFEALEHPFITMGPLPHGRPWQPVRRVVRSRPVPIENPSTISHGEVPNCASAPNFLGHDPFAPSSSLQSVGVGHAFDEVFGAGPASYAPESVIPASVPELPRGFEPPYCSRNSINVGTFDSTHHFRQDDCMDFYVQNVAEGNAFGNFSGISENIGDANAHDAGPYNPAMFSISAEQCENEPSLNS